jgi:hypothetical protein
MCVRSELVAEGRSHMVRCLIKLQWIASPHGNPNADTHHGHQVRTRMHAGRIFGQVHARSEMAAVP